MVDAKSEIQAELQDPHGKPVKVDGQVQQIKVGTELDPLPIELPGPPPEPAAPAQPSTPEPPRRPATIGERAGWAVGTAGRAAKNMLARVRTTAPETGK